MNQIKINKSAKTSNREKFLLEKLKIEIQILKEKEHELKRELSLCWENLNISKQRDKEIRDIKLKIKLIAEEEIMKNKKDHLELSMLIDIKKNFRKELDKAIQDNLKANCGLDNLRENKIKLEKNLINLQETYENAANERNSSNKELIKFKQEYDELLQIYDLNKSENFQLKSLYKFHFK